MRAAAASTGVQVSCCSLRRHALHQVNCFLMSVSSARRGKIYNIWCGDSPIDDRWAEAALCGLSCEEERNEPRLTEIIPLMVHLSGRPVREFFYEVLCLFYASDVDL